MSEDSPPFTEYYFQNDFAQSLLHKAISVTFRAPWENRPAGWSIRGILLQVAPRPLTGETVAQIDGIASDEPMGFRSRVHTIPWNRYTIHVSPIDELTQGVITMPEEKPLMTGKHFRFLAKTLREYKDRICPPVRDFYEAPDHFQALVSIFADNLETTNPRFNRKRFSNEIYAIGVSNAKES